MSLMTLHLSSRQLYMGSKQRPALFTAAVGVDWHPSGSVCFDLLCSWRSGKVALAVLGACGLARQSQTPPGSEKHENNTKISRSAVSPAFAFPRHAGRMHVGRKRMNLRCWSEVAIGVADLLKHSAIRKMSHSLVGGKSAECFSVPSSMLQILRCRCAAASLTTSPIHRCSSDVVDDVWFATFAGPLCRTRCFRCPSSGSIVSIINRAINPNQPYTLSARYKLWTQAPQSLSELFKLPM